MSPFRALAVLATLTFAPSALAVAEVPVKDVPYVFATVDNYAVVNTNAVEVTGILVGETLPRVFRFTFSNPVNTSEHMSRCDRLALLAMSRPGRYLLEFTASDKLFTPASCKLTRQ